MRVSDVILSVPTETAESFGHSLCPSTMTRFLPVLLALWFLSACASDLETVEITNRETGYVELFQRSRKTGLREGFYRKIDPSGLLVEEAEYREDRWHGKRRLFDERGKVLREETHEEGHFHGPYRTFYPDGALDSEGQFEKDEMTGIWKRYYPSGQLMEEVLFSGNLENGPFREWHANGKLKAEGAYLDGDNEQGELLEYDTLGVLQARKMCERGICRTLWTRESGNVQ